MSAIRAGVVLATMATVALVVCIALGWGGNDGVVALDDILSVVIVGGAAAATGTAARYTQGAHRRAWWFLTASLLSWSTASAIWAWFELVRHTNPYPSVADVGYIAAVPLAAASLWSFGGGMSHSSKLRAALDGIVVALSAVIIGWQVVLERAFSASAQGGVAEVLGVAYPLGDVVLIAVALHVLLGVAPRRRSPLRWVVAGLALFAVADGAFAYLTATGHYQASPFTDAGWLAGAILMAVGGRLALRPAGTAAPRRETRTHLYFALRFLGPAIAVAAVSPEFLTTGHVDTVVFIAGAGIVTALAARQGLAMYDSTVSEQKFRLLAENARDLIFRLRLVPELRYEYVSPAAERITGHSPEDFYADPLLGLTLVDPAAVAVFEAEDLAQIGHRPREIAIRHDDGTLVWAETTVTPVFEGDRVVAIEGIARDVTERKEAETRLAYQALHDPLTSLPNRILLIDRVNQALARANRGISRVAVFYVDLDHFKRVNDAFGHAAGDELLIRIAGRLVAGLRPTDTVARLGGDEFVIVTEWTDEAEIDALIIRIASLVEDRPGGRLDGVVVAASIGLAVGEAGDSAEKLLAAADAAMYRAKGLGRGRTERFDEQLRHQAEAKIVLERELRAGLARGEFVLHYQPVVALDTGIAHGAEALVRWNHPTRGLLAPADFVELAEETGLIGPLGAWVFREACRESKRVNVRFPGRRVNIAVNVSAQQLTANGPNELARILDEEGVDPSSITVEMTENAVMGDVDAFSRTLASLKALGLHVAIDDFGTGYSSLGYLRHFPVDILKIDQSFVDGLGRDEQDDAVVAAIMSLARSLGLSVVAEGVETAEQAATLRELGCFLAQGYLFSRPMPAEQFYALLATERAWQVA
ncbi:MAG TPA: EAL domain-containing protein [Acidimicrobiales bacterium]|nr:EAL domain-containing protein [Acidimicrobiales bacterium]